MHEFNSSFYGQELHVCVAGFIRPEQNYSCIGNTMTLCFLKYNDYEIDDLISDIEMDKKVALNSLNRPHYQQLAIGLKKEL